MRSRLVHREALAAEERDAMLTLLESYFEGISSEQFRADLSEKDWIVLVESERSRIVGFSTIRYFRTSYEGRRLGIVYSGDTIIDRSAWKSTAFFRGWIAAVRGLHQHDTPLYWFLLVSGFRTYRLLPVLWREFFPRFDRTTPRHEQALVDHLAQERFGELYDRSSGIVRFEHPQVLRDGLKTITPGRLEDPHVAFFAERNPGHLQGDELVCLTEISNDNLTPAGLRMTH